MKASNEWNEGLYLPFALPTKRLLGISKKIIQKSQLLAGVYTYDFEGELTQKKAYDLLAKKCTFSHTNFWSSLDCNLVKKCILSKDSCKVKYRRNGCSGVAIEGGYYLTARHCYKDKRKNQHAKFLSLDGKRTVEFKLIDIGYSDHKHPYDISIFKLDGWPKNRPTAEIKTGQFRFGQTVFGIGFPYTVHRKTRKTDYPWADGDMRVTTGTVTEPNNAKKTFCQYSNNIFEENPQTWRLTKACSTARFVTKKAKEDDGTKYEYQVRWEKNIMLTNSDMINGLSGSPLFDSKGMLVGIGTTVMKGGPPLDYSPDANAVYSKAENIYEFFKP